MGIFHDACLYEVGYSPPPIYYELLLILYKLFTNYEQGVAYTHRLVVS